MGDSAAAKMKKIFIAMKVTWPFAHTSFPIKVFIYYPPQHPKPLSNPLTTKPKQPHIPNDAYLKDFENDLRIEAELMNRPIVDGFICSNGVPNILDPVKAINRAPRMIIPFRP